MTKARVAAKREKLCCRVRVALVKAEALAKAASVFFHFTFQSRTRQHSAAATTFTFYLLSALLLAPMTRGGDDQRIVLDAATLAKMPAGAKRVIEKRLAELPGGYKLKPQIVYRWSEKTQSQAVVLVSLTPLDWKGRPDGEVRYYHRHGTVVRTIPYKAGKKHGTEKKYSPVNRELILVAEIPWQHGKIVGIKKLYYRANGKPRAVVPHVKGVPHGVAKQFDLPGRITRITRYRKGKRHGEMTEYWPAAGKVRKRVPCRRGKVHGTVKEYFEDGRVKRKIQLRHDKFHGVEKVYGQDGEVVKTRYWLADEPVSKEAFGQNNPP